MEHVGPKEALAAAQQRFEQSFVRTQDGCWEWQDRGAAAGGYGRFTAGGTRWQAHRAAYQLFVGDIPDELCVLHRCDNRPCVRPDHLFLGTRPENTADMVAKGRQARGERQGTHTHPQTVARGKGHWTASKPARVARGVRNAAAKLTAATVRQIRSAVRSGVPQRQIAERFGISQGHVSHIAKGKFWKPDEDESDGKAA